MTFLLVFITFLALYCPIYSVICLLVPFKGFVISSMQHRKTRYAVIHLALFSRIGHLNKTQLRKFNSAFVSSLQLALQKKRTIVFRSHLMRGSQVRLAETVLAQYGHRYRVSKVTLSRTERVGITCQMLFQEWRPVRVPREGVMFVVMMR
ncbi:hypothetical protein PEC106568_10570 [Pectobacterium carotovorum subsp. carotovorum]|nr:hypothetical protein PEC106568_10570 [Pectobacterium carotovorum subsp. carotovorum]